MSRLGKLLWVACGATVGVVVVVYSWKSLKYRTKDAKKESKRAPKVDVRSNNINDNKEVTCLLVGEACFSFTEALLKLRAKVLSTTRIVASNYENDVSSYGKPAEDRIKRLSTKKYRSSLTIRHGVNALCLGDSIGKLEDHFFDHLVFVHPHIGVEDARAHESFVAHFLDSARSHLSKRGTIHLVLLEGQVERWKVVETGERMGFAVTTEYFSNEKLEKVGYQQRRTTRKGSFRGASSCSLVVSFTEDGCSDDNVCWGDLVLNGRSEEDLSTRTMFECKLCEWKGRTEQGLRDHMKKMHGNEKRSLGELPQEKPETLETAPPPFRPISGGGSSLQLLYEDEVRELVTSEKLHRCPICNFWVREEVLSDHHLEFNNAAYASLAAERKECVHCKKSFPGQRALEQHIARCHS